LIGSSDTQLDKFDQSRVWNAPHCQREVIPGVQRVRNTR
jgi:hypothetical protein